MMRSLGVGSNPICHMMMEAGIGVLLLEDKECLGLPGAARGKVPSERLWREPAPANTLGSDC